MTESREDLEARIAAYIDGQLPPAEAARLEVFLANTDPRLAEQIIGMLEDRHRLRTLPKAAAPVDLAGRVMEQVERATLLNDVEHFSHPARPWWQSRLAVAAGFILVLGGFSWLVVLSIIGPANTQPGKWTGPAAVVNPRPTGSVATASPTQESGPRHFASVASKDAAREPPAAAPPRALALAQGNAAHPRSAPLPAANLFTDQEKARQPLGPAVPAAPDVSTLARAEKSRDALPGQVDRAAAKDLARNDVQKEMPAPAANGSANEIANNSKSGFTLVNSSLQALNNVVADESMGARQPVVVTLVAHDARDFGRLQGALVAMMNQEPAIAKYQNVLQAQAGNNLAANGNSPGNFGVADHGQRRDNNSPAQNQVTATPAPPGNAAATTGGLVVRNGGYNFYNPARQQFEYVPGEQPLASNDKDSQAATAPAPTAAPTAAPANSVAGPQAQVAAAARVERQQLTGTLHQVDALQSRLPAVYRVALRQDQVRQLAGEFQVVSITSGGRSYVIRQEPPALAPMAQKQVAAAAPTPATYDHAVKTPKSNSEERATPIPSAAALPPLAPAASVPVVPQAEANGPDMAAKTMVSGGGPKMGLDKTAVSPAAPQQAPASRKDAGLAEYIITMEPAPGAGTGGEHAPSH